jgi:hypothetical protein
MLKLQEFYYRGCKKSSKYRQDDLNAIEFYKYAINLSAESITSFIRSAELNIFSFEEYLKNNQANKIYIFYKDGEFYKQVVSLDDITPVNY